MQARQINRKLIKEDAALRRLVLNIVAPLCGFVFKMQFSGNVLFEIIIFEVRKMIKFESTLLSRVGQSLTL